MHTLFADKVCVASITLYTGVAGVAFRDSLPKFQEALRAASLTRSSTNSRLYSWRSYLTPSPYATLHRYAPRTRFRYLSLPLLRESSQFQALVTRTTAS